MTGHTAGGCPDHSAQPCQLLLISHAVYAHTYTKKHPHICIHTHTGRTTRQRSTQEKSLEAGVSDNRVAGPLSLLTLITYCTHGFIFHGWYRNAKLHVAVTFTYALCIDFLHQAFCAHA